MGASRDPFSSFILLFFALAVEEDDDVPGGGAEMESGASDKGREAAERAAEIDADGARMLTVFLDFGFFAGGLNGYGVSQVRRFDARLNTGRVKSWANSNHPGKPCSLTLHLKWGYGS